MQNTTKANVPAAIIRNAEEEIAIFLAYVDSPEGSERTSWLEHDFAELELDMDLEEFARSLDPEHGECGDQIIEHIRDKLDYAEGVAAALRIIRDTYTDRLGIPAKMKEAALRLHEADCNTTRQSLKEALGLVAMDRRRMPEDIVEALRALGMPRMVRGVSTATFRGACLSSYKDDWIYGSAMEAA